MSDEQLEFRLTLYLDGSLPVEDARALFDELAKNREALVTLDEYRKLDLLMSAKPAAVRWDALAEQISAHIDEDQQSRMRIGVFAAPLRIAIAAAVVLAVGVGSWMLVKPGQNAVQVGPPVAVRDIHGPTAEAATGVAVATIEIGEPTAQADDSAAYYGDYATRPQRVIIASGVNDRQDERPY